MNFIKDLFSKSTQVKPQLTPEKIELQQKFDNLYTEWLEEKSIIQLAQMSDVVQEMKKLN